MKIVKFFEDEDFFEKYHNDQGIQDDAYKQKGHWYWGLSDDGDLCYHSSVYHHTEQWIIFNSNEKHYKVASKLSLKDMKKIVKEFGHLLVWI